MTYLKTCPRKVFLYPQCFALLAWCVGMSPTHADVVLAPLFRDHAILQRDKEVPVWGRADPGETVSVSFQSQKIATVAAQNGRWRINLKPMTATRTPGNLVVAGKNTVTIRDVVVGEVWLCSGQSNMGRTVSHSLSSRGAQRMKYPLIREFTVQQCTASKPADDVAGDWRLCSPETVRSFSATAFFFGLELYNKLDVPVGLIHASWGGTQIESWMGAATLQGNEAGPAVYARWQKDVDAFPARFEKYQAALAGWKGKAAAAKADGREFKDRQPRKPVGPGSQGEPSALYNAMILPLHPAAIRGVIWYQGEANSHRHVEYRTLFPAMIKEWRADFQQGDLPFYYVQLANLDADRGWAFLREAQESALKLPNTGQAVTIDIGDSKDVHPKNKQEVGRRLALIAFAKTYGLGGEFSGPVFAGIEREPGALRVKFRHAEGLTAKDPVMPGFVVAGTDQRFYPASAKLDGETVVVSSPEVPHPVAVRYAWANDPPTPLYNGAGLPAGPFRSDDWEK